MSLVHAKLRPIPLDDQIKMITKKIEELEQIDHTTRSSSNIHKINFWRSVLQNLNKLKNKKS